jgi:hypothetical protein
MRLLHLFSGNSRRTRRIKTEVKVALIALLGAIIAAAIPVAIDLMPKRANLSLISVHVGRYSYGLSTLGVLDLKLENSGGKAARITEARIRVDKIFRFDAPVTTLFRIPAQGTYDVSLANLAEGGETRIGLYHEVPPESSDRIIISLGGDGLSQKADGPLGRGEPSYLARITVALLRGESVLAMSSQIDVLVLNMDHGTLRTHASNELQDDIGRRALPTMTRYDIRTELKGLGLSAPEWLEDQGQLSERP